MLHGKQSEQYNNLDLDFSVKVCHLWEKAFFNQRTPFTRKVVYPKRSQDEGFAYKYQNVEQAIAEILQA